MKLWSVAALAIICAGCAIKRPAVCRDTDALDTAVLFAIQDTYASSYDSDEVVHKKLTLIAREKAWAETLKEACVRDAYEHWLGVHERKAMKVFQEHEVQKELPPPPLQESSSNGEVTPN